MMKLIQVLKLFGLSDYEARALVALISRGALTAKEVAEISGIPRTSVYDVMKSLLSKGFVETYGKPLKFKALKAEEIISILKRRVNNNLDYLKQELPKLETKEVDEIIIYREDLVLEKLRQLVLESRKVIMGIASYIPAEVRKILENKNKGCKLILVSSNATEVVGAEAYEFKRKEEILSKFKDFCHGLFVFDEKKALVIFLNKLKIGVLSDNEGVIQFSKMLILSLIEFIKQ